MGKNDFDINFDFDEEYDFDPKAFLGDEEYTEDIDLSEFTDEELGLSPEKTSEDAPEESAAPEDDLGLDDLDLSGDFDLDSDLDLDEFLNLGNAEEKTEETDDSADLDFADDFDMDGHEDLDEESDLEAEEDPDDEPDFFDDIQLTDEPESPQEDDAYPMEADLGDEEIAAVEDTEKAEADESVDQTIFEDETLTDKPSWASRRKERKESKERKPIQLPKITMPNFLIKFFDIYFAPLLNKSILEEPVDPNNPRRRRRKSKVQIFKEVYLPPIIACVCLIFVLSFVIGSISNVIDKQQINAETKKNEELAASQAADLVEAEYQRIKAEAAQLVQGYDYETAIKRIDSFSGDTTKYQDLVTLRAQYVSEMDNLVEYNDPSSIPNLSFHCLIVDIERALRDEELGGKYNRNFVTTDEFTKILNQLYTNGYVLVDFDSFTQCNSDTFFPIPITLPEGKKPIMITETLANYLEYMIDSNGDGAADAGGDGFASKLVLDSQGNIKAEYVDANGTTNIGDYDLVPILESFIEEHPDFSYQGARATVAVCGYQGVFGYRTNTSYIASKGQSYYDEQCQGAKTIAQALRDKGYTIACYTYNNEAYGKMNAATITADLQSWTQQITPVIGEVNTLVFAQSSSITDWSGSSFNVLYTSGFRYFVGNGTTTYAEVNNTYVRQNRLMVSGNSMAWYSSQFNGIFDCAAILDVNARGNVPN